MTFHYVVFLSTYTVEKYACTENIDLSILLLLRASANAFNTLLMQEDSHILWFEL